MMMQINQQILQEIPISNIEVAEIPLKQFSQRKIFSQDAPKKKNNKYQIILSRHQRKEQSLFMEPSKIKSVRFKEEIEIIDNDILYNPEQKSFQQHQKDIQQEEKLPTPSILFPLNKISFPLNMDKVRQQIDNDLQQYQKQTKNIQTPPEIPKRFQSVSRQERDKKINRLNNAFDPWNVNYTFAPISARSSSTSSAQQNLKNQNNSYNYIQEYSEQYSYRSFYKVGTNSLSNTNSQNRPRTNQKSPNDSLNSPYPISNTTPIEQLVIQSTKSQYKTNFSFTETASNYKNFAPYVSNTPTKIYNQNRQENQEQDNSDNLPQICKVAFHPKSTTPINNNSNNNNNNFSTKASQQITNNTILTHKDEDQQQLGEMLYQLKNHINLKKQQNQIKNKSKSPRRLQRLSIDMSNQQVKENKTQQKFQSTMYKQNIQPPNNEQKPNKVIPEQIKNALFKKIAEQKLFKQKDE